MSKFLTIVIPTHKYNKYLDLAIASCLAIKNIHVHVNINSKSKEFESSKYWMHKQITWRYISEPKDNMRDSINDAINNAQGEWLFILSDDDMVLPKFMKDINLDEVSSSTIYATRINIIDQNNEITRINERYNKCLYTKEEALELFFSNKLHHHLSSFIFHRDMFLKYGPLPFTGYPNNYYLDSIFHGKLMANCSQMIGAQDVVFSRREFSDQASAKFYFDKEVNNYFDIIVNTFFEDDNFKKEALKRYGTKEAFYRKMLQGRFFTEWSKLNKSIYNKSLKRKLEFFYKHLLYWKTGGSFKIFSLFYMIFFGLNQYISPSLRNKIKKIIGR